MIIALNEFFVAADEAALAEKFVNAVSDRIAALFISREDRELATIWVRIHNVRQLSQVLAAETMLQQQAQVQRVHLQGFQQGVADFQVQVRGGRQCARNSTRLRAPSTSHCAA